MVLALFFFCLGAERPQYALILVTWIGLQFHLSCIDIVSFSGLDRLPVFFCDLLFSRLVEDFFSLWLLSVQFL